MNSFLIGLGLFFLPLISYICARLAGIAWYKGRLKYLKDSTDYLIKTCKEEK